MLKNGIKKKYIQEFCDLKSSVYKKKITCWMWIKISSLNHSANVCNKKKEEEKTHYIN